MAEHTEKLTALLAEESGRAADDVETATVAAALMGAQRALVAFVHGCVLAGRTGDELAADARAHALRTFERLEAGLGDYGVRRG